MATLDDLVAGVAAQKTKIDSLVALTGNLHTQVIAAMGSTITPSQQQRIDAVFKGINDNADEVQAAIDANTDAAQTSPPPAPASAGTVGTAGATATPPNAPPA